jgi:hypothetical protein
LDPSFEEISQKWKISILNKFSNAELPVEKNARYNVKEPQSVLRDPPDHIIALPFPK